MCGLVAVITKHTNGFKHPDKAIFTQMLYADALRGLDSTGVFGVNEHGNLRMHKSAQKAGPFIETKIYQDFADDIFTDFRFVVGHNRAATKGAKIDENAHPFIEDHICLVHNGTLHSHKHLANVEVDSHAITKAFAEKGYEKTIPEINGAYALIWYDAKQKSLYITRNYERPLHMAESADAFYIASELEMLQWILSRNNVKHDGIKFFDTKYIYRWDLGKSSAYVTEEKPLKKALPVAVQQPATSQGNTKAGGNKWSKSGKPGTSKHYPIGALITFTNELTTYNGNNIPVMTGKSYDGYETKVRCLLTREHTPAQIAKLMESDLLDGVVTQVYYKDGVQTLVVRDPTVSDVLVSLNNTVITSAQFFDQGEICTKCGQVVSDAEVAQSVVKVREGQITSLICPECVADMKISIHPKWGEGRHATC